MIRPIVTATALAVSLAVPSVSHAALFGGRGGSSNASPKLKMVKITLRNRTAAPMNILIEDKPVTIAANGEYELKAAEGTHVYGEDRSVKLLVTRDLDGTACSFR